MNDCPGNWQGGKQGGHHDGHVDLVMEREGVLVDHIDVSLGELAEAPLLWSLSSPHLLYLIPAEWEFEFACVLDDVACERNSQIKVQAKPGVTVPFGMESPNDVDLLVDLSLAGEFRQWLNCASLDRRESMEFEYPTSRVEDRLFDYSTLGQPFGETRKTGTGHRYNPVLRSATGPWAASACR